MSKNAANTDSQSSETQWADVIMNTYGTPPLTITGGNGATLTDSVGKTYIDLLAGIAVNSLGHAHPAIVEAVTEQISNFAHVSNLFGSRPVIDTAARLIRRFAEGTTDSTQTAHDTRVFFCNSGTEANEAAFKLARMTGKNRILAAQHGFHGRTMGALAMTGQPDKQMPFYPLPAGVEFYPYGDIDYLRKLVQINSTDVAAIILEPIQGETGVIPAPDGFLSAVRGLCNEFDILMIVDEVQTGIGRTGDFFAFQHETGVIPDVVTMAKGLGGGLPIGACLATGKAKDLLGPGKHGTTFGGNPVSCAAAGAVLHTIDDDFLENVQRKSHKLVKGMSRLPLVESIRGRGLMLGVLLSEPVAKECVKLALEHGLIVNAPSASVLRLTPPLVISDAEIHESIERLSIVLTKIKKKECH